MSRPPRSSPSLLGADQVDLWTADLVSEGDELERAARLLSRGERERFDRVIRPLQRERLILARAVLRQVLSRYLQIAPEAVVFGRGPHGKPCLHPDPGLSFNLSHAGALAVVAVTERAAVGVDIEMLGRRIRPGVLRRALAPAERERVLARPPEARDEAFLRHWTAKEAYAKAIGVGLAVGMAGVQVRNAEDSPELADADARARFTLQRFDPRPGVVGAVAVAGGAWRARRPQAADEHIARPTPDSGGVHRAEVGYHRQPTAPADPSGSRQGRGSWLRHAAHPLHARHTLNLHVIEPLA